MAERIIERTIDRFNLYSALARMRQRYGAELSRLRKAS
jgi:hypothetical protein